MLENFKDGRNPSGSNGRTMPDYAKLIEAIALKSQALAYNMASFQDPFQYRLHQYPPRQRQIHLR